MNIYTSQGRVWHARLSLPVIYKDMLSIFKQKGRYFYQSDFLVKILTFLSQKNQLRRFK